FAKAKQSTPELLAGTAEAAAKSSDNTAQSTTNAFDLIAEGVPESHSYTSFDDYQEALRTHSAAKVQKDELRTAFKLPDGTITKGEPGEPHVLLGMKLPEGAMDSAEAGFADKSGNFYTRAQAMERYRVTDARDINKLQDRPDPVVY